MREHLYRGKTNDGKWVYGNLVETREEYSDKIVYAILEKTAEHRFGGEYADDGWHSVVKDTIGEYTGLTDKNGKKIFEGDILLKPNWYVAYANGENESYGMACGWYLVRDDFESWSELTKEDAYEVIGNIYDNPELLNDKND